MLSIKDEFFRLVEMYESNKILFFKKFVKFTFDLCLFLGVCGLGTKILILTYQSSIGYRHLFHPVCYLDGLYLFIVGFYFWVKGLKK